MTRIPNPPADTRMMGIVHDALRRDPRSRHRRTLHAALSRARPACCDRRGPRLDVQLPARPPPWPRRRAVAAGTSTRSPHLATAGRHGSRPRRVSPLVEACHTTARDYRGGTSDEARVALLGSLERLCEVLLPHLRREEDEAMPLVSVTITDADWHAVDQQYFIKPKSLAQLGVEGHWLLDGLDPERSQLVVHQVPTIPRLLIVHGFKRRYRRRATACWGPADSSPGVRADPPTAPPPCCRPRLPAPAGSRPPSRRRSTRSGLWCRT